MKTANILSILNLIDEFNQQSAKFKYAYVARLSAVQEVIIEDIREWLERTVTDVPYDLDFVLSDLCLNLELWHLPRLISDSNGNNFTNWTMQEVWIWENEESREFVASEYLAESINLFLQNQHLKFDANNTEIDLWLNNCMVTLQKLLNVFSTAKNNLHIKSAHIGLNIILTRMLAEIYTLRQFRNF